MKSVTQLHIYKYKCQSEEACCKRFSAQKTLIKTVIKSREFAKLSLTMATVK